MLLQLTFFEDFYLNRKVKSIINETKKFSEIYSYQIYNQEVLIQALFRYEQENNAKIAILSMDGNFKLLPNYDKTTDDFRVLTQYATELINDIELINKVLSTGKSEATIFENKISNTKKIGIVSPMSLNSKNDSVIISVSSMQPINEAGSVIREFYKYLFMGFSILGLLLSSIYANLISKPLVNINKVAKRMSSMDFTAKCKESSNDEIGNLAVTLNFLSSTLKNTLDDLKKKNKKLEEDIEKERKLEEMRKDFVASVSHDLKTPIGIIEGYAEGLKDGIATGENALIYIDTIIDEAQKMNKLVTNMLELSKLESGNINLVIENFNILRLIKKLIKSFSLEFSLRSIKLKLNTPLEYCYVNGDIFQLEQALTNIISNALKYTPNNSIVIIEVNEIKYSNKNNKLQENKVTKKIEQTNEIEILSATEGLVNISVENKGSHIPEEEIEKLFAKFYRLDKSRNTSKNSNGLGLAIIKKILDLHKSPYSLSNTIDGVKFEFTLKKANDLEIV